MKHIRTFAVLLASLPAIGLKGMQSPDNTLLPKDLVINEQTATDLIHIAIHTRNNLNLVDQLVSQHPSCLEAPLDEKDEFTPLAHAVIKQWPEAVQLLLEKKADVLAISRLKQLTPLHIAACAQETPPKPIKIANIDDVGYSIITIPASAQAQPVNVTIAQHLLRAGAPLEMRDKDGNSPLYTAAGEGPYSMVKFLIEQGADCATMNNLHFTLLHIATNKNDLELMDTLIQKKSVSVDAASIYGGTPLHGAAMKNTVESARLLLDNGANINAIEAQGHTPLHLATYKKNNAVVKLLLERGADKTIKSKQGLTPLEMAQAVGNTEMLPFLK